MIGALRTHTSHSKGRRGGGAGGAEIEESVFSRLVMANQVRIAKEVPGLSFPRPLIIGQSANSS